MEMYEYIFSDGWRILTFIKKYAFEIKAEEKNHGKCVKKGKKYLTK